MRKKIGLIMATFGVFVSVLVNGTAINRVNGFKIRSSWRELVDTATITLPLVAKKPGSNVAYKQSLADRFKNGDRIEIKAAYEGIHGKTYEYTEFKGFVKKKNLGIPLTIECEDASFLFRKVSVYKEWRKADNPNLLTIVNYLVEEVNKTTDYKITLVNEGIPTLNFLEFRIGENDRKVSAAEALQFLKDEYGLAVYFDDLNLHVRLGYTDAPSLQPVTLNLAGNVIEDKLTVREANEVQIYLEGKAILKNNTVIEAKYPTDGKGDARPFVTYDAKDEATLINLMKTEYKKLGAGARIEGSLSTFLVPFVRHSMIVNLKDPEFNIKKGQYLADSTELEFGANSGIKRTIVPGIKLG